MPADNPKPNRLINETSPYLRQHAYNPVDWYPWCEEALGRARAEEKPIFLSIGYSACHWCHVMERESFMDEQVAQFLNENFISIKVDREERPDLDNIYMSAVVQMTGQGGWPTTVFLTPDQEPFFGGTYFPPTTRHGLISFIELLRSIQEAWQHDRSELVELGGRITSLLRLGSRVPNESQDSTVENTLLTARDNLLASYDWQYGGWGRAPKFPQPMLIEFLLTQAFHGHEQSLQAARHALDSMQLGGMHDLVGGGFHRYSTDLHWLVPHFEKMLYDNAQLALAYLHAYLQTGNESYRRTSTATLDFILRELTHPDGGFYSSLDADSEGVEGAFYTWTTTELESLLSPEDYDLLQRVYQINPGGNFEGKLILQRTASLSELVRELSESETALANRIEGIHALLQMARERKPRPSTDTKVLLSWNALALRAFAEAGRYLARPDYLEVAKKNAFFLLNELRTPDGLQRSWRDGAAKQPAFLEDYAALVIALLTLYQCDNNVGWYTAAEELLNEMDFRFSDPQGGYYDTQLDTEELIIRPKDLQDNATPCGNSLAAYAALLHGALTPESKREDQIRVQLKTLSASLASYPSAFGFWLLAYDLLEGPIVQIALVLPEKAKDHSGIQEYLLRRYQPRSVLAVTQLPLDSRVPELLKDRPVLDNQPTAYICEQFVCHLPVTSLQELKLHLP